ncbi:MAG TPA: putative Ig domain-containing protein, partial [Candidatus Saccharimonadia bacterium]|nr:putative Ig domain-containing protein [Candidatus Saccharimonadia bacterium]
GTAWGNFIGPGNIVSGNLGDGIALDPGSVKLPNFIAGNLVGLGSAPGADVGNAVNGISVDTFPKTTSPANPTGIAAIIGPANAISDNKSTVDTELDVTNGDTSGGMIITGSSLNIRVFANVFGLATIPAGATPLGQLNFGNAGNGLVVTTPGNEIRNNLILANGRHGILLRGTSANNNIIRGNYVGVSVPTGLAPLVGLGNIGDGIHRADAASNFIGGPAASDANFIAGNRRNGVAMRGSGAGWANLVTRNRIYGNALDGTGIGIDLDHPRNGPDGLDTIANPGMQYPNLDQHRPALCGGAASPPVCGSTTGPSYDGAGGGTALKWTVLNRPNTSIRLEFFANAANGTDQVFLGEKVVSTDGAGLPTGAGCSAGACTASVGGATDTTGMSIVATSTDLLPSDVPPSGGPLTPANNTSEFSDPLVATRKLEITTAPPLPGGTTNQPYTVTFAAIGGSGTYTSWAISNNAPPGVTMAAATGVLSGTPSVAGSFTFSVEVTDSVGAKALAVYTIVIAAQPPLVITTATPLPNGTVGSAYALTFAASGGNGAPGNWQLQGGELPPGLSRAAATGVLDGTPTDVGTYEFNVRVTDQQPTTVVKAYTLTIQPAPVPLSITTASPLPNATQSSAYDRTLAATGGSGEYETWGIVSGALPAGVALGTATGRLTGTPSAAGNYAFTVRVIDDAGAMASKAFALTVLAPPPPPPAGPIFSASPADIDFGAVDVGRTAIVNVRLTNLHTEDSVTPRLTTPPAASGFTVDAGTCTAALAPGQFCTMMVAFTPTASDETEFASGSSICRTVLQNRCTIILIGGPATVLARLTYRGVGTGTLAEVSPSRIDFGPQLVGTTSGVDVDIRNPTDGLLTFNPQPALSNPAQFSIVNTSCGIGQLAAGGACRLTFRFSPVVPGAAESSARLTIGNGTLGESYDIEVRGTGTSTAQPTFTTPMKLDFGMVDVSRTEAIPVVTRNASGVPLSIVAAPFGASDADVWSRIVPLFGCPNPIANNANCTYSYRFTPRAQGVYSIDTQLAVTGSGVDQLVPLALTGTGVGSLVEATPVVLDFGVVNVGDTSRGTVTIVNRSVDTLTRTFAGALPFLSPTTCPIDIAPGATCTINYRISPDGELIGVGPVATQVTLLFENVATGNSQLVTIDLGATIVDALFQNGYE